MSTRFDAINDKLISTAHFTQEEGLKEAAAFSRELGDRKTEMKPLVRNIVRHVDVTGYESVVLASIQCLSGLVADEELVDEFHKFEGVKRLCGCIGGHKKDTVKEKGLLLLALIAKDASSHNAIVSQGAFDVVTKLLKGTEVNLRLGAYVVARRILSESNSFHRQAVRAHVLKQVTQDLKLDDRNMIPFDKKERLCQLAVLGSLAVSRDAVQDLRIGDLHQTVWRHVESDDPAISLAALKVFKEWAFNDDHSKEALVKRGVAADLEKIASASDKQMIKDICAEVIQKLN